MPRKTPCRTLQTPAEPRLTSRETTLILAALNVAWSSSDPRRSFGLGASLQCLRLAADAYNADAIGIPPATAMRPAPTHTPEPIPPLPVQE